MSHLNRRWRETAAEMTCRMALAASAAGLVAYFGMAAAREFWNGELFGAQVGTDLTIGVGFFGVTMALAALIARVVRESLFGEDEDEPNQPE